jgi:hypothetical protein
MAGNRRQWHRYLRQSLLSAALLVVLAATPALGQRELVVEIASGDPGETVNVSVTYTGDGTVTGLQFDLTFDNGFLTLGTATAGPALTDHDLDTEIVTPGMVRILVHSPTNDILADGVVTTLPFTIDPVTPDGFYPIDRSGVVMGDPNALGAVPTNLVDGGIQVGAGGSIGPDNLLLENQTVSGIETFEACQTITTGPNFEIVSPAEVSLRAGIQVILGNGTTIGEDVVVTIEIDPALNAAVSGEDL